MNNTDALVEFWLNLPYENLPYDDGEAEEEVHPMYCQWCGAEYGEDWAQCECYDELEIES